MAKKKTTKKKAAPIKYKYKKLPSWAKTAEHKGVRKGVARQARKLEKYDNIQKIERLKREVYRREHPVETRVRDTAAKGVKGVQRITKKFLGERTKSRKY